MQRQLALLIVVGALSAFSGACASDSTPVPLPTPETVSVGLRGPAWYVSDQVLAEYVFSVNGVDYPATPLFVSDDPLPATPWYETPLTLGEDTYDIALVGLGDGQRFEFLSDQSGFRPVVHHNNSDTALCLTRDTNRYRVLVERDDEFLSVTGDKTMCVNPYQLRLRE